MIPLLCCNTLEVVSYSFSLSKECIIFETVEWVPNWGTVGEVGVFFCDSINLSTHTGFEPRTPLQVQFLHPPVEMVPNLRDLIQPMFPLLYESLGTKVEVVSHEPLQDPDLDRARTPWRLEWLEDLKRLDRSREIVQYSQPRRGIPERVTGLDSLRRTSRKWVLFVERIVPSRFKGLPSFLVPGSFYVYSKGRPFLYRKIRSDSVFVWFLNGFGKVCL